MNELSPIVKLIMRDTEKMAHSLNDTQERLDKILENLTKLNASFKSADKNHD